MSESVEDEVPEWIMLGICYEFKVRKILSIRKAQALEELQRYPNKIPVVAEEVAEKRTFHHLENRKFMVPRQLTTGQFYYLLRECLHLSSEAMLFVYLGGYLPRASDSMGDVYEKHRDEDGFLYAAYSPTEDLRGPKMIKVRNPKASFFYSPATCSFVADTSVDFVQPRETLGSTEEGDRKRTSPSIRVSAREKSERGPRRSLQR